MKKLFALILTIAMLMTAAAAIAEGQGGPMGGPQQGQQDGRGQQPPEKPSGEQGQQAPEKPSGEQGQQAPQKPDAAPEKPSGEKPADAPEEPEDLTGEKPADATEKPAGEKPADTTEEPEDLTGEKPADAPEKPSGEQGQQPRKADDKRIDFDAMVTSGVIFQETRDKIMAYMNEHKPEGAPADGQQPPEKPADDQAPTDGQQPDLLSDLLNAGVITQAEYEALTAAQTAA